MTTTGVIVTAVLALAGSNASAALIKAWFDRRKLTAQAQQAHVDPSGVLSEAAVSLIDPLRRQRDELLQQLSTMRTQLVSAQGHIRELEERLAHYERI